MTVWFGKGLTDAESPWSAIFSLIGTTTFGTEPRDGRHLGRTKLVPRHDASDRGRRHLQEEWAALVLEASAPQGHGISVQRATAGKLMLCLQRSHMLSTARLDLQARVASSRSRTARNAALNPQALVQPNVASSAGMTKELPALAPSPC